MKTVNLEVGMIQDEEVADTELFGENHQGCIGQVHGPVLVFFHQGVDAAMGFQTLLGNFDLALSHQGLESILSLPRAGFARQVHGFGESGPGCQNGAGKLGKTFPWSSVG